MIQNHERDRVPSSETTVAILHQNWWRVVEGEGEVEEGEEEAQDRKACHTHFAILSLLFRSRGDKTRKQEKNKAIDPMTSTALLLLYYW